MYIHYKDFEELNDLEKEQVDNYLNMVDGVQSVGNAADYFDRGQLLTALDEFFSTVDNESYFVKYDNDSKEIRRYDNYIEYSDYSCHYSYRNGRLDWCDSYYYRVPKEATLGVKPVVTLNLKKKNVDTELESGIKVGDYVKYEANSYSGWRVLSIDNDNGTVDLVSGGIVKNDTMNGADDYNQYSDILQSEVDAYKNGDNVVSARPLNKNDIAALNAIKDDVNVKYWINNKKSMATILRKSYNAKVFATMVGYYNGDEIVTDYISLFIGEHDKFLEYYSDFNNGNQSYLAGIRPVVTVKSASLKKLSDSEVNAVEKSSKVADKTYENEQQINNKGYKAIRHVNNESSSSENYSGIENKNDKVTEDNNDVVDSSYTKSKSKNNDSVSLSKSYLGFITFVMCALLIFVGIVVVLLSLIYKKIGKFMK